MSPSFTYLQKHVNEGEVLIYLTVHSGQLRLAAQALALFRSELLPLFEVLKQNRLLFRTHPNESAIDIAQLLLSGGRKRLEASEVSVNALPLLGSEPIVGFVVPQNPFSVLPGHSPQLLLPASYLLLLSRTHALESLISLPEDFLLLRREAVPFLFGRTRSLLGARRRCRTKNPKDDKCQ